MIYGTLFNSAICKNIILKMLTFSCHEKIKVKVSLLLLYSTVCTYIKSVSTALARVQLARESEQNTVNQSTSVYYETTIRQIFAHRKRLKNW